MGAPLDQPDKVSITRPLVGDEPAIEMRLFEKVISTQEISIEERFRLDERVKRVALAKGYDAIVLMTPKAFAPYKEQGKIPRSIELNVLKAWM
ncbi:MAG: hypothetical protein ACRD2O_17195 [Terriglobia bacterium]